MSGTFLYNFDDKTGLISNERMIDVEHKFSYGVEFSPLSKKLYVSTGKYDPDGIPQEESLYQFTVDLPVPTSSNINAIIDTQNFSNAIADHLFVRVENQLNCHVVTDLQLQVSTTQIPADYMIRISECDNNLADGDDRNGITTFDFSNATQDILDLFPADQKLVVTYYENMEDALSLQSQIHRQ